MSDQVVMGVESWPSGLNVMVVDGNSLYLLLMEQLLRQCNYKVTSFKDVPEAISYATRGQHGVDIVISDVFLPSEEGLFILKAISFQLDIPVVMMSWCGETNLVMKYVANGACDFLIKPLRVEELRNIWQHVFRKQMGHMHMNEKLRFDLNVGVEDKSRKRGVEIHPMPSRKEENDKIVDDVGDLKKYRLQWTEGLHRQFVSAVNALGAEKAVPKKILEVMRVKQLTREHVASHLQKYRSRIKKTNSSSLAQGKGKGPSTPSTSSSAGLSSGLEDDIIPTARAILQEQLPSAEKSTDLIYHEGASLFSDLMEEFSGETGQESSTSRCLEF